MPLRTSPRQSNLSPPPRRAVGWGRGELRIHRGQAGDPVYIPVTEHGVLDAPSGADILLDQALIRTHFPYLTEQRG